MYSLIAFITLMFVKLRAEFSLLGKTPLSLLYSLESLLSILLLLVVLDFPMLDFPMLDFPSLAETSETTYSDVVNLPFSSRFLTRVIYPP